MYTLPCVNCITLPICKSQYMRISQEHMDQYSPSQRSAMARSKLTNKCHMLNSYIYYIHLDEGDVPYLNCRHRKLELHNFMGCKR